MTVTEARPEAAVAESPEPVATTTPESWFTTGDHKKLGLLFVYGALLFVVVGAGLGVVLRAELAEPGINIVGGQYTRLFSMHATVMTLLFLAPAWIGLATYLVPLQIGSGRLAFPRLQATALWLFLIGGGLMVASYLMDQPDGIGITVATPADASAGPANHATTLWIASLLVLALATMLAATTILTSVVMLRTDGMSLIRVPAFSWASAVTSAILLFSTPVFIAGLTLFYLDQRFGGTFFASGGSAAVWQHLLWLFGRPEIYLLTLPGLGAACDIVSTHTRRGLLSHIGAIVLLSMFGVLSLGAWAAGLHAADAVVVPTYTILTSLVALPIALLVLMWLAGAREGQPRLHVSLLFVAGFVLLLVTGAANAIAAAFAKVDGPDSAWTTGNLHVVAFGAPTLLLFGAIYHWAPTFWGRSLSTLLGGLTFLALFGGFFIQGMASYALGYQGATAHTPDLGDSKYTGFSRLAATGGIIIAIGIIVFLIDLVQSLVRKRGVEADDDPY